MTRSGHRVLLVSVFLLTPTTLRAQEVPQDKPVQTASQEEQARPTGLPSRIKWTFNLDAGWGSFGFANSLFINPREPGVDENLSDQWFEGYAKPALSATYTLATSSEIYGKLSVVGERTYGSVPAAFGEDVSSFGPEDLSIGWRSGKSLRVGENALDFVIGRTEYRLGHGFLLWDGAAEGGSRGGYWTNARKAFEFAAVGRFQPGSHKVEAFYLDKDELEESDSGSRLWGTNYEYRIGENTTLGATYMKWFADVAIKPERDGLNVFNLRAYTAPLHNTPDLSFEVEYASERNGEALDSNAWTFDGAYELSTVTWKPKLSYRYAFFQGDDPETATNEAFDPLFLGFHDWGTWWQGEIAGEYFLSNSNLKSHLVRVHVTPRDALSGGLMFYKFAFDQPRSVGPDVTATDAVFELDAYADWKLNQNLTVSFIGAYADPGKAVQQATGRTKNFAYGMAYVGYSF
jgi:Alginate export